MKEMKLKKFKKFIENNINEIPTENDNEDTFDINSYSELLGNIKKMISETIGSENDETITRFIKVFVKPNNDKEIIGLINDTDVYDLYLKYMTDIDSILNFINFYNETPKSLEVYSLYDYIIKGTKISVLELLKKIK